MIPVEVDIHFSSNMIKENRIDVLMIVNDESQWLCFPYTDLPRMKSYFGAFLRLDTDSPWLLVYRGEVSKLPDFAKLLEGGES